MEYICEKNALLFKLNNFKANLKKFGSTVNKLSFDYNVNEINNNSMKMFKISVECNGLIWKVQLLLIDSISFR